jgi:hypothetical protein
VSSRASSLFPSSLGFLAAAAVRDEDQGARGSNEISSAVVTSTYAQRLVPHVPVSRVAAHIVIPSSAVRAAVLDVDVGPRRFVLQLVVDGGSAAG